MVLGSICILSSVFMMIINFSKDDNTPKDNDESNEETTESKHTKEVKENIENIFLNDDTSSDKIEEITGKEVRFDYVVLGSDSYLRSRPTSEVIASEKLDDYVTKQDEYAKKVEKNYRDNTKYVIVEGDDKNLNFQVTPWYFALYSSDLSSLKNKLLEMANVDLSLIDTDYSKYSIYEYKARVKAMIILDSYLNNYKNENENIDFVFYYENDKPAPDQYLNLYYNLIGSTSKYMTNNEEQLKVQVTRVNDYLNQAIENGLIDKNDVLGL